MRGNNNDSKLLFLWPPAHSLAASPGAAPSPQPRQQPWRLSCLDAWTGWLLAGDSASAPGAVRGVSLCAQGHMEASAVALPLGILRASGSASEYGDDSNGAQTGSFFFKSTHLLT